ncbi:hypothetical protein BU24DRAFT_484416 [Aaosphaeria arxii CBS 175.79]|uniref:RRM domain-containing protein n=1 Tax=Aaosphaeria arxii CBS 175.79 TaxID=1450172 RepID=A0A6A5XIJ3_9PLEO|nr:uncharacterized protein BU24DRAFT_484416 [Aaosphaeria arxii CBS 175.79]KAF2012689.1 hypothetical protein BU24DRAFT_484416 [Aaosphaeria arxii CBS 175.79]
MSHRSPESINTVVGGPSSSPTSDGTYPTTTYSPEASHDYFPPQNAGQAPAPPPHVVYAPTVPGLFGATAPSVVPPPVYPIAAPVGGPGAFASVPLAGVIPGGIPHVVQPPAPSVVEEIRPTVFLDELDPRAGVFHSRYLEISGGDEYGHLIKDMVILMKTEDDMFDHGSILTQKDDLTRVWIYFDDTRAARQAYMYLRQLQFEVRYALQSVYAQAAKQDVLAIDRNEGQIALKMLTRSVQVFNNDSLLADIVKTTCSHIGEVRLVRQLRKSQHSNGFTFTYRVEFFSVLDANRAVTLLKDRNPLAEHNSNARAYPWETVRVERYSGVEVDTSIRPPLRGKQYIYRSRDAHNRVYVTRVLAGLDVRSTLMLRNIPNEMNWMGLKKIMDAICIGSYDFVYLRMDFTTQANVGYAFINFSDLNGIVAFVNALDGQQWTGYRSTKAVEISYATIQGKEALVTKFRNSSVMQESPNCKPRLFNTFDDVQCGLSYSYVGTEQAFPEPDNIPKLQRSCASASQNGLFPPKHKSVTQTAPRVHHTSDMHGNGHHTGPHAELNISIDSVPQDVQQFCENWYARSQGGYRVPFLQIPQSIVVHFLQMHFDAMRLQHQQASAPGPLPQAHL